MRSVRPAGPVFFPLDEELALLPGELSPWLQESLVRLGTWLPSFQQAAAALAWFSGVAVHESTVRRQTEAAGAAAVALQTAAVERLEERIVPVPAGPTIQQLSADGAMVPLRGGAWAEAKTVAIGVVQARPGPDGAPVVHTEELSYFSRLADHASFSRLATAELHRRGTATAQTVAAVVDGSVWLQEFIDTHRPDAVRILDFPHAVEHLSTAAQASLGVGTAETTAWLAVHAHELKVGDPDAVLAALRTLPTHDATDPAAAALARDQALAYLVARREQIAYAQFQAQGLPIGSGSVESANKLVVEARLKGAGMHWARSHVDPMLALRTIVCNNRWDEAWPQIAQWLRTPARRRPTRRCAPPTLSAAQAARPLPRPRPPTTPKKPSIARPAHAPRIVNGRPTPDHPWKKYATLTSQRVRQAQAAKS